MHGGGDDYCACLITMCDSGRSVGCPKIKRNSSGSEIRIAVVLNRRLISLYTDRRRYGNKIVSRSSSVGVPAVGVCGWLMGIYGGARCIWQFSGGDRRGGESEK